MLLRVVRAWEVSKKRRDVQGDRLTLLGGDAVLLQPNVHPHAVGLKDHAVLRQAAGRGQCSEQIPSRLHGQGMGAGLAMQHSYNT